MSKAREILALLESTYAPGVILMVAKKFGNAIFLPLKKELDKPGMKSYDWDDVEGMLVYTKATPEQIKAFKKELDKKQSQFEK